MAILRLWLCYLPLIAVGCGSTTAPSAPDAAPAGSNPWTDCYASFTPEGSHPKGNLHRLTHACGRVGGMRPVTPIHLGHQRERDPADRYVFNVERSGSCYRVFATGDPSITDLDLLLRGPSGEDLSADLTHDAWPILPPHGPLCFDTPGLYMLEVSVLRGAGYYAVQVWGN